MAAWMWRALDKLGLTGLKGRITVLAAFLLAAAGVAYAATARERSLAIYPPQVIPLNFNHKVHMEAGMDCTACHAANKSTKSSDNLLPHEDYSATSHPECEDCHDIEAAAKGEKTDPPAQCELCHAGFDRTAQKAPAPIDFPAPNLIFDHNVHVKGQKIDCKVCHTDVADVRVATRQQLPKMGTCLTCHDGRSASAECKTCHLTQPSGRLQLTFVSGLLRPMQGDPFGIDHGPRYEFNHASMATTNRQLCMQCHSMQQCNQCHDALQKPLSVHPNDYITLHPVQARLDNPHCESCHRLQSFCVACHERTGVGLSAAASLRPTNVRVHPPTAVWVDILGPQHHGIAANRNINACVSCHRQEDCLACHSDADRFGTRRQVDPHPPGFQAICKTAASKNDRACLVCHSDQTLARLGCR